QSGEDITRLRSLGACQRLEKPKDFDELFALWHGRPPLDEEWPAPRKIGTGRAFYEWLQPEIALLASLVGRLGSAGISQILTDRLRQITGDDTAERNRQAVQIRTNLIGLQSTDVLNGITIRDAGREIKSVATVEHNIRQGNLPAFRVGRLWVIPHDAWA